MKHKLNLGSWCSGFLAKS